MKPPKQKLFAFSNYRVVIPIAIVIVIAGMVIVPRCLSKWRYGQIKKDMQGVLRQVSQQKGVTAELSEGCGKNIVKYGGGPTICSVGVKGLIAPSDLDKQQAENYISAAINENNFGGRIQYGKVLSRVQNEDYTHRPTRQHCSLRYEDQDELSHPPGDGVIFSFYCSSAKDKWWSSK